jgi:hypothetical protein
MGEQKDTRKIHPGCDTLILAEGVDAKLFLIWALEAYELHNAQVESFDGISKLNLELKAWQLVDGFDNIKKIIIARDAETDSEAALKSVKSSLKRNKFPVPDKAFQYSTRHDMSIAILLFPGLEMDVPIEKGTLEDLCLRTVKQSSLIILQEAERFVFNMNEIEPITRQHKAKLHTYLSVNEKFIGMKIGEAAKSGAWDWNSEPMIPFKKILAPVE